MQNTANCNKAASPPTYPKFYIFHAKRIFYYKKYQQNKPQDQTKIYLNKIVIRR